MARVVCLGAALQDIFLIDKGDKLQQLELGSKADIDGISYQVGGGGANAAVSFARHGHETILFSSIAHDAGGAAILETLDRENIDSSYVQITDKHKTGCSVVLLDEGSGERTILTHRGAAHYYSGIKAKDLELVKPDWLYITSLGGDFKTLNAFCTQAHKIGAQVMFNPGQCELDKKKELTDLLAKIDILLVNKQEAKQIVHGDLLEELLAHLRSHVPTVIITSGSMGGAAVDEQSMIHFGLYSGTKVVDTTGAGDAFGSGFLAHFADRRKFQDALIFASANSAAVISKLGAQAGILTGHEHLHPMPLQTLE